MEISIDALMDKLKQVKKLGIKNDFKNIDSKTYGKIILLVGDLDNVIEKYELDKMTGELKAWQDGSLINTDAINKLSLGDLERVSKILEGVK